MTHRAPSTATPDTLIGPEPTDSAVERLAVPGVLYNVRPGQGKSSAVICTYDLGRADALMANRVAPTWSSPELVLAEYGLELVRDTAQQLLDDVFAGGGKLKVEIESNDESRAPELIFRLEVPKSLRDRRAIFLDRYVRAVSLPADAPVPGLLWAYR